MRLIFASNNEHKIQELKAFAARESDSYRIEVVSLKDAGIDIDIPEPHDTLEENASEKSWTVFRLTGNDCFSEDTGLEIEALNGEPGVKSARYAGEARSFKDNIAKVLSKLANQSNRNARFRAVISLIIDGNETQFEGICNGKIIDTPQGTEGFGYDPIFIPNDSKHTFAEMSIEEKNRFNHRAKAAAKLVAFLQNMKTNSPN
ncbi:MAG TPA: RdgB/HAM1 family non-canonical purine NTP pyrophosphatase [Chitinophagaceae bacterium]|jgi:XTP/dITP diphosphohydrolase|nr:RdgB/HAM1 family non-canonical purine NTP pyrophosphatase [Chitinophagaceae bacterium]